jgi:hypothetical protein
MSLLGSECPIAFGEIAMSLRFLGLDRRSWNSFIAWVPTSLAACILPLEFALMGVLFKEEIYAHPIASTVLQLFVFVAGNLCDNLIKEKEAWFSEPPRNFPSQELVAIFHVGLKVSIILGGGQYLIFMSVLNQPLFQAGLVLTSSITMVVITAIYPPFYLASIYFALKLFPRLRGQISRFALPVRNVLMTPLASYLVYVFVAPHLR